MIPKIIHYCWFGRGKMPKKYKNYILKWEKLLFEYKFVLWNEDNFDINSNAYVKEAYANRKWAFVSDYVRLYALFNYGGVYFDTDMEIIQTFDNLLTKDLVLGFEENLITTGFIACNKNNKNINNIIRKYYVSPNGYIPNTKIFTDYFFSNSKFDYTKMYQTADYIIYPFDYFCCNNLINITLTNNSRLIHHYGASWFPWYKRLKSRIYVFCLKYKILWKSKNEKNK